jgi:multidrug efflux pump subunit AcrA (membrane-fusion protein)
VIVRGKVSAKDRNGALGSEVKILADDAREITHEQAQAYQSTGRKQRTLKTRRPAKGETLKAAVVAAKAEKTALGAERLYVRLHDSSDHKLLSKLRTSFDAAPGDREVVLVLGTDQAKQAVKLPMRVTADDTLVASLQKLVGSDNVKFA